MIAARGFSLVDLLVALACTGLLAAGVSTLLVGSAAGTRHAWAAQRARGVAGAAVARVATDIEAAGFGLERADALLEGGVRVAVVGSVGPGHVRVLRALGDALEIAEHVGSGSYEVAAADALVVGDKVAAIDLPGRPAGAPLPTAAVIAVIPLGPHVRIDVAWPAAAAATLAAWGEPRALLPVRWRDYATRPWRGELQLRRRDEGGSWQPVVDGVAGFRVVFAVDTDGDGLADRADQAVVDDDRVCGVRLVIEVPFVAHRAAVGEGGTGGLESAARWVDLPWC